MTTIHLVLRPRRPERPEGQAGKKSAAAEKWDLNLALDGRGRGRTASRSRRGTLRHGRAVRRGRGVERFRFGPIGPIDENSSGPL
jgi:hypothetical protein